MVVNTSMQGAATQSSGWFQSTSGAKEKTILKRKVGFPNTECVNDTQFRVYIKKWKPHLAILML